MNPLSWLNEKVLGGALAASLIVNVFLFWGYTHQTEQKATCTQAVQTANKQATEKKIIIERRQDNVTNETEARLRTQLADLKQRLHDREGRVIDLSRPADPAALADGAGSSPLLLPEDELICDINTVKAATWQVWYAEQVKIREEENDTDTKDHRVLGSRGGIGTGSLSGQRERLDLGAGSDEPVGAPSLSPVSTEPAEH